jgi:hypothetical protein
MAGVNLRTGTEEMGHKTSSEDDAQHTSRSEHQLAAVESIVTQPPTVGVLEGVSATDSDGGLTGGPALVN